MAGGIGDLDYIPADAEVSMNNLPKVNL